MTRTTFLRLCLACACATTPLMPLPSHAYTASLEQETLLVDRVEVTSGVSAEDGVDVSGVMKGLKTQEGKPFSQRIFDEDLKTLAQRFFRVEPTIEEEGGSVTIKLKVWPKPVIREIHFAGNVNEKESDLRSKLGKQEGAVYDPKGFNTAFHKIQAYYVKQGYFEAQLSYRIEPLEDSNDIAIFVDIEEGRSGRIQRIEFVGLDSDEETAIAKSMLTQSYSFFTSWLTSKGTFNPDMVEQDRLVIIDHLQNLGYADAQVEIRVKDSEKKNRIIVEVEANKGEVYRVGEVRFSGNTLFSDEQIEAEITLSEGKPYSPRAMRELVDRLQMLYGRQGYIEALATYRPILREDAAVYDVELSIREGKKYQVGMIKVIGNRWTQTKVILRETVLIPGETFDMERLRLTEERLFNVGYFSAVNVYPIPSEAMDEMEGNYRDVVIEVEETGTGSFGLAGGYSNSNSFFIGLNVTEKNFNIAGIPDVFSKGIRSLRGGGEYLALKTNLGLRANSYTLSWTKPYIFDSDWIFGTELDYSSSDTNSSEYIVKALSARISLQYPVNQFVRFGTFYRISDSKVTIKNNSAPASIKLLKDTAGLISAIGGNLSYDSTDHPIRPHNGFRSSLLAEYAGLGANIKFFHWAYTNSLYISPWEDGTFRLRGDVAFIKTGSGTNYDTVPVGERLFLGGETSIRGFKPGHVGPLDLSQTDPIGGLSSTLLSIEYAHEVNDWLEPFTFFDAGGVRKGQYTPSLQAYSTGIGVRAKLVPNLPPITFGYAWPLEHTDGNREENFFVGFGGAF